MRHRGRVSRDAAVLYPNLYARWGCDVSATLRRP